ncbi:MAG: vWA domain-containing protein [Alkalispirochaetaceae bacterium]
MIFGFPGGLYLLSLLPIIVIAHLLRQRRVQERVSSILLWKELRGSTARRPRWRRLLNIHFLLQCLAVILAAIALAEPMLPRSLPPRRERQIIIADTSASMGARSVEGERIALLRRAVGEFLRNSEEGGEITVIELSREPRVRGTFIAGDEALLDLVETLRATDEEGNPEAAMEMALRLAGGEDEAEIHLFTDGAFSLEPGLLDPSAVSVHLIGEKAEPNAGIVAFAPEGEELFVALEYHGSEPATRELQIVQNGVPIVSRLVELLPGERESLLLPLPGAGGRNLRGELTGNDALGRDNRAYAVVEESRSLEVALVSPGNPFLEAALTVHPRVLLERYTRFTPAIEADLFVFDRLGEVAIPRGRVLSFATTVPGFPVRLAEPLTEINAPVSSAAHPVTRALDFGGTYFAEAQGFLLPPEVTPLLIHRESPIAFAGDTGELRVTSFGFDLTRSNLPLQPLMPLVIERAIHYLTGGSYPLGVRSYRAGERIELELSPREPAELWRPDGGSSTLDVKELSQPFTATRNAGIYTLRQGGRSRAFAVNLLSSEETDLSRRLAQTEPPVTAPASPISGTRAIWRLLALAALLLALLDVIVPRRRAK